MCRYLPSLLLVASLSCLAGCGPNNDVPTISGVVTLDDKPLEKGSLSFVPVDGKGSTGGAEIVNGKYSGKISPGKNRIEIRSPKIVGKKKLYEADPNSPIQEIMEEALPKKYNESSELTFDAQSGANKQDWNLKSK